MNRKFLALPLWMAVAGAAWGQARAADVLYAGRDDVPVHAYRVGDECFVPLDAIADWKWRAERDDDVARLSAEGVNVAVPARVVAGRPCLALRRAVRLLGADSEWVAGTDTLRVYAPLTSLTVSEGQLEAVAPLPLKATGFALTGPNRAVVDLVGARLPERPLEFPANVRATQFRPNVVRIVVELSYVPAVLPRSGIVERRLSVSLAVAALPGPARVPSPPPDVPHAPPVPPVEVSSPELLTVALLTDAPDRTVLQVSLARRLVSPVSLVVRDPATLEITLPSVWAALPDGFVSPTPVVTSFEATRRGSGTILTLRLARPARSEVVASADGVRITLRPMASAGTLAGKVIVVDPGHGGHDSGATGGSELEQRLPRRIGTRLAAELERAGAAVLMTRRTDVFVPLQARSDLANRSHADLFVSIHINSSGGSPSQSGSIAFHHGSNPAGRRLAERIEAEIARVNGLPNLGAWSDTKIYASGFSVLRNTRQPAAVLLELGFMNHPGDRARMVTGDFQSKVAAAIACGIRAYLEGEP